MDLPDFFNRIDFIAMYLPGYVVIIVGIVVLVPSGKIFSAKIFSTNFDFLASVLFIIAGPAIGVTLSQLYRSVQLIYKRLTTDKGVLDKFLEDYAKVRLNMNPQEADELDSAEAYADFSYSTSVGLIIIMLYEIYEKKAISATPIALLLVSIILLIGAYYQMETVYEPTVKLLRQKYP